MFVSQVCVLTLPFGSSVDWQDSLQMVGVKLIINQSIFREYNLSVIPRFYKLEELDRAN